MKISVVIPVYNAEKYLGECVESVLEQKLGKGDSLEVLAVDNGSTDGSLAILKKYPEVKILHCATPGAAAVRNFGLKKATGDYVWFVDADDYLAEGILGKLVEKAKTGADLVTFRVQCFKDDLDADNRLYLPVDLKEKDWKHRFLRCGYGFWQFLMCKEFLVENKLYLHEGIICEDVAIVGSYILYTDKIAVVDEVGYYYRQRSDSVSHPKVWGDEALDVFAALEDLTQRFVEAGKFEEYREDLEYVYIWHLQVELAATIKGDKARLKKGIKMMHDVVRERFPKWRQNRYLKSKGLKARVRAELGYWGMK